MTEVVVFIRMNNVITSLQLLEIAAPKSKWCVVLFNMIQKAALVK